MKTKLNRAEAALVAFTVLCVCDTVGELVLRHPVSVSRTLAKAVSVPKKPVPAPPAPSLSDYRVVAQRPLFTANRKPYEVPIKAPVVARPRRVQTPVPAFALNAVIRTSDARIALLSVAGQQGVHKMSPGESLAGWTLNEVRVDAVVLERAGKSVTVLLHPNGAADRQASIPAGGSRRPGITTR